MAYASTASTITTGGTTETTGTWININAASPLFTYEPVDGWSQDAQGGSTCSGMEGVTYAVGLNGTYFTQVTFLWSASTEYAVSVGIDGQLQSGPASSGGVTLNAQAGTHAIRLEPSFDSSASSSQMEQSASASTFQFVGVRVNINGSGNNVTVDDADPRVVYTGFASTPSNQSQIPAIQDGTFYQNTISYTSSAQASASLTFEGSAIYLFGPTGPSFGVFQVNIDGQIIGTYNASTTVPTSDTLLFFTSQLDPKSSHQIIVTNEVEGFALALDYFAAVTASAAAAPAVASPDGVGVWPGEQATKGSGDNSSSVLVGGLLGGLLALLLLVLGIMYWRWKKVGGEGSFWTAFCGPIKRALKIPEKDDGKFQAWPMLHYQPKYAVEN